MGNVRQGYMPKVDLRHIPIIYPDAEGRVKCLVCANLTIDGKQARCLHVGTMSAIAVLRECKLFKQKGD